MEAEERENRLTKNVHHYTPISSRSLSGIGRYKLLIHTTSMYKCRTELRRWEYITCEFLWWRMWKREPGSRKKMGGEADRKFRGDCATELIIASNAIGCWIRWRMTSKRQLAFPIPLPRGTYKGFLFDKHRMPPHLLFHLHGLALDKHRDRSWTVWLTVPFVALTHFSIRNVYEDRRGKWRKKKEK